MNTMIKQLQNEWLMLQLVVSRPWTIKDLYFCPIEITQGLTDKGQFQYLTGLKWPQEGTYLYTHNFFH